MRLLEILSDVIFQDRGRKWPERFALFDARVQNVFHFRAARIDYDRSIAERGGRIRRETGIRLPDALIAATALERGLILTTRNVRDFETVPGLRVRSPN